MSITNNEAVFSSTQYEGVAHENKAIDLQATLHTHTQELITRSKEQLTSGDAPNKQVVVRANDILERAKACLASRQAQKRSLNTNTEVLPLAFSNV